MALTRSEQVLLEALAVLPPNNVYADAGKREILTGFRLYTDHRIAHIGWEANAVLLLQLAGDPASAMSRHATVRVSKEGDHLKFRCSHPDHNGTERCSHVVAALITLVHFFKPSVFKMAKEDLPYRDRLAAGLFKRSILPEDGAVGLPAPVRAAGVSPSGAVKKGESRFEIIVEETAHGLRAFAERDGKRVVDPSPHHSLPLEIAYLVRSGYRQEMSLALFVFLKRAENRYPVYYSDGSRKSRIQWLGEVPCATWTELDVRGDEIVARKACSLGKDKKVRGTLIGDFVFNDERTQMGRVIGSEGWHFFDLVGAACRRNRLMAPRLREADGRQVCIPLEVFRAIQFFIKRSRVTHVLRSLLCMAEGRQMRVRATRASNYMLVIGADKRGRFTITPQCRSGEYAFSPSQAIISFVRSVELGRIPLTIRTKKRKPVLYDALFRTLALDKREAVDEQLRRTIDEEFFGRRQSASEARSLIKRSLSTFMGEDMQLHFTGVEWQMISVDKEKEKHLFSTPFDVFGPALYDRIAHHGVAMSVSEEELFGRLRHLHALAVKTGIELSFDGRPVEQVSWEFAVDATGGTIDWFEIRPEIRCNGEVLPKGLWEQALSGKGVVSHGNSVQVLDEASLRGLALVAGLWGGTKKAAGPRQVTSIPRLRIIDLFALRKKGISVRLNAEDEAMMARLVRFTGIEERRLPALRADLWQYQREGYHWLAFLYENGFGACLADDMGLGKTVQAICLLAAMKEGKVAPPGSAPTGLKSLVVVPPSLIFNWEREIERFYPELCVRVYRGRERSAGTEDYDVLIASYGLIRRHIARLKQLRFNVIIFDEAQAIKNIFADTTHAVRQLKALFKIALTGTPVENHLGEYFSIMDLVLPGLLGDYREFQGRAKADAASVLPGLKERTRPFVLRRTKERILKELPPKIERDVYLELTEEQKRFYTRTVQEVRSTVDAAYRTKAAEQARIIALTAIMKLRQICLTPRLLVEELKEPAPKIEFLKEKLSELCDESHSSLVFSQFTSFLDLVEEELRAKGLPLFRLDGSTRVSKRKGIVDGFQESRAPAVFLLSLKAGGRGLNLTRGAYVFHLDPWWNPAVENQASDRSHRIGQENKVIVTRLLMRHTIEEKMTALKNRKLGLYHALLDGPGGCGDRAITKEDFEFLLG
jgi:non-specific serine/threonine protein kinase